MHPLEQERRARFRKPSPPGKAYPGRSASPDLDRITDLAEGAGGKDDIHIDRVRAGVVSLRFVGQSNPVGAALIAFGSNVVRRESRKARCVFDLEGAVLGLVGWPYRGVSDRRAIRIDAG